MATTKAGQTLQNWIVKQANLHRNQMCYNRPNITTIDTDHNPCRRRIKESRRRVDRDGAKVAAEKKGRSHLGCWKQTTQTTSGGCWKQTAQTTSDVEDIGEQEQPPQNHRHWSRREIRDRGGAEGSSHSSHHHL